MTTVLLDDVIRDVQSGFATGERSSSGVVQVRMNNVSTDGHLSLDEHIRVPTSRRQLCAFKLETGDVLFNSTNSPELVGKSAIFKGYREPVVFSNHFLRLRTDTARLLPDYLVLLLTYQWQQRTFDRLCTRWVNQAAVRKEDLLSLPVMLPSLDEQKRIVALLDKADRLRRTRRYAQELSGSFLQSIFLEMFGNPVTNSMGWEVSLLEDLGDLDRGRSKHRPRNAPQLLGGPYPLIQTGEVADSNGYIRAYKQTYSEIGLQQSKMWPKGTLCITIAANIAKTGILLFDACFPDSVVGFTANSRTNVEYVQQWFSFLQPYLERTAPESAQKNINLEILRDLQVLLPPLTLQERFAAVAQRAERLRTQQREAERQAEHLFQTLLHRAFSECA